jgi:hypothetical protein
MGDKERGLGVAMKSSNKGDLHVHAAFATGDADLSPYLNHKRK